MSFKIKAIDQTTARSKEKDNEKEKLEKEKKECLLRQMKINLLIELVFMRL